MADIQKELNDILNAIYGEEVRSSIHDAISKINKVGEVVLTLGTNVTSTSSSTSGFYSNSVYLNTNTWDMWKCTGSSWTKVGNLLGSSISSVVNVGTKTNTNNLVNIYSVRDSLGQEISSFEVTNGNRIAQGAYSVLTGELNYKIFNYDGTTSTYTLPKGTIIGSGTEITAANSSCYGLGPSKNQTYYVGDYYINTNTWDIWKCIAHSGTNWSKIGSFKSVKSVDKTNTSGLVDTYTVYSTDNSAIGTFTVTNGTPVEVTKANNVVTISATKTDGSVQTTDLKEGTKIGIGNFVTTANTSTKINNEQYYANDIYINNSTWIIWKCNGTGWTNLGALKSIKSIAKTSTDGYKDTYTITLDNNENLGTFEVSNGKSIRFYKGTVTTDSKIGTDSTFVTADVYPSEDLRSGDILIAQRDTKAIDVGEYALYSSVMQYWQITAVNGNNISVTGLGEYPVESGETGPKGDKGDKGDTGTSIDSVSLITKSDRVKTYGVNLNDGTSAGTFEVIDGEKGDTGFAPTVEVSKTGIITTVTITDVDGSHNIEIKDGESGDGSGDMLKSVYDENDDGVIDLDNLPIATESDLRSAMDEARK